MFLSDHRPARPVDQRVDDGSGLVGFVMAFLAASAAFLLAQGLSIGVENFFTPIHHDDFSALASSPHLDLWLPRPVSSNFIYMLGSYGAGFYYSVYICLCMTGIAMTEILAIRLFRLRLSTSVLAFSTFAMAFAWFSLGPSVAHLQYLGLSTNVLSSLFAAFAAVSFIGGRLGLLRLAAFTVALILSVFAKEDMAAFFAGVIVLRALRDLHDGMAPRQVFFRSIAVLAFVVGTYALSVLHSQVNGSPFTAGTGFYDMSTPLQNVIRNSIGYWTVSPATRVVIAVNLAAILALFVRFLITRSWGRAADIVAAALPFALVLPYVALPRFADYYTVTFVPLMIAVLAPALVATLGDKARLLAPAIMVAVPALVAAITHYADAGPRASQLQWYAHTKQVSRHHIDELRRAAAFGLLDCQTVAVTGVSASLGPFLNGASAPVDRYLGKALDWRIATVPGTVLESFAKAIAPANGRWTYSASEDEARRGADCLLAFDERGYAGFERLGTPAGRTNPQ